MTKDDVLAGVERVRGMIADNEGAHVEEDNLMWEVLKAIANGAGDSPVELAQAMLTLDSVKYQRWYA